MVLVAHRGMRVLPSAVDLALVGGACPIARWALVLHQLGNRFFLTVAGVAPFDEEPETKTAFTEILLPAFLRPDKARPGILQQPLHCHAPISLRSCRES